ncbi:GrBNV gp60-like protein-like protein [Mauternbach virus]|uniref:GrBNV gp60-like protein-like protein n=1 Tax=Mauternbach virus TaxID=2486603 RepID=A0A3G3E656_9VIRU|nr:GrBNV gp60-like protein-like protein [Mauternbach virus]AYP97959.1 GrBNV gp60-like protein-like protein [Mauternbach virus]
MSISINSYESVIKMACEYYDSDMPIYFCEGHYNIACDIVALLLQKQEFSMVRTNIKLLEPIMEYGGVIYFSLPLIALLVNTLVELPKNSIEYNENFNIFDGLNMITEEKSSRNSCFTKANSRPNNIAQVLNRNQSAQNYNKIASSVVGANVYNATIVDDHDMFQQFTPVETIRFTQVLRLVLMCAHFYQHYTEKTEYTTHRGFKKLEIAKQKSKKNKRSI